MKIDEFTKRHQLVYDMLNNDQYSEIKIMLSKNAKNIGVETEIVFTDFFGQSHTFINKKLDKKKNIWYGTSKYGDITIAYKYGNISGSISIGTQLYQIDHLKNDFYILSQINNNFYLDELSESELPKKNALSKDIQNIYDSVEIFHFIRFV